MGHEPRGLANRRMLSEFLLGLERTSLAGSCVGVGCVEEQCWAVNISKRPAPLTSLGE